MAFVNMSFNPFKLWGSYAGLIIAIILASLGAFSLSKIFEGGFFIFIPMWAFAGFFIGYFIHIAIRHFKK